jgi:hypothetical protein
MYIQNNTLDFVNDNAITIVDRGPYVTEHVEITNNTIINPVVSGIYFGADGDDFIDVPGMTLRDVTIAGNRIVGFFATAGIIGRLPESATKVYVIDNFVQNQRDTPKPGNFYVHGIMLDHSNSAPEPATDIRVDGNTVVASGIDSVLDTAGIRVRGSVSGLSIANNKVLPKDRGTIGRGIRLGFSVENVEVHTNTVNGTGVALDLEERITNANIHNNILLNSTSASDGQIRIDVHSGETIEARIAENRIQGGAGYGILCKDDGTFLLTDLLTNDFIDNARGNIAGCP